jgi:feruloyl esterase
MVSLVMVPAARSENACAQSDLATLRGLVASIKDAPTLIDEYHAISATGALPAYCRLRGTIAPQIAFELRLPTDRWNGKLLMQGCGGMCGWLNTEAAEDSLERGYATVTTDMGHRGSPADASWAHSNRSAELDFAYRSTWATAVVAKILTENFYRNAPRRTYFNGCSTGGRQGMLAAQRFPELFDGIVAGAPVFNQTGTGMLHLLWAARANVARDGRPILSAQKLTGVHQRVIAACDLQDGIEDGVIPDPRACDFSLTSLACGNGRQTQDCLTRDELDAMTKIYRGASNSSGRLTIASGGGQALGSEYNWSPAFVGSAGQHGAIVAAPGLISQLLQFMTFYDDLGPNATLNDFDFERDVPRLALTEVFFNVQNPDLRRFKARGGKLILYHGWDDIEIPPGFSLDYYETVTRTMGGPRATRDFFRLFMVPGMAHCRRGNGADAIDYVGALARWVEDGVAPHYLLAHKLIKEQNYLGLPRVRFPLQANEVRWRRPIYAYPEVAVYRGRGDSNDPAQWRPKVLRRVNDAR